MIRGIGWAVSLVLAFSAYLIWMAKAIHQITFLVEKPSSFVGQWLQLLARMGVVGSGLIIILVLLFLIWKPWRRE